MFVCLCVICDVLCDSVCVVSVCACVWFDDDVSYVLACLFVVDCVVLHGLFVCVFCVCMFVRVVSVFVCFVIYCVVLYGMLCVCCLVFVCGCVCCCVCVLCL